jgi:hypothetical protein
MSVTSLNFGINESALTPRRLRTVCFYASLSALSLGAPRGAHPLTSLIASERYRYNLKVLIAISASLEAIAKEAVAAGDGAFST